MTKQLLLWALGLALLAPGAAGAETCLSAACHVEIAKLKHRHEPAAGGDCLFCHKRLMQEHPVAKAKSFQLTARGEALCAACHQAVAKRRVVHAPVRDGDCGSCHKAHGAQGRFLLENDQELTGLCLGCHDGASFTRKFVHGPVAEGACLACHNPHDSSENALLKDSTRKLCLSCHEEFARGMRGAAFVHKPVKEKPCTSCHDPHSSAFRYLLKKKMPELCVDCHQPIGKKLGAKVVHRPLTGEKGCGSCHSTHFSKSKALLTADDERSSCLACHASSKLGTPPLRNMKTELEGKKQQHGPLMKGRCSGCHDPHGSDYPRILTGSYPKEFYVPFRKESYGLCLSCHDGKMLDFAETTLYTKFRHGSRNLHYLHVNNSKGRSCKACHEPHAASGQKLIGSEGVRFGEWRVRSRFQLSATGGSCAPGCHQRFSYDRNAVKREILPLPN